MKGRGLIGSKRPVVPPTAGCARNPALAERLIEETCRRQQIAAGQLTIHADRGTSMTSKPVALLLSDLGVTKSHSRPHVSNDNPYSEAQFKTLKYRPAFPERFGSLEDSRGACGDFFGWYNLEHHHSGLGLLTPHDVHHGLAPARVAERAATLASAWRAHPERFPRGKPAPPLLPSEAWINRPKQLAASAPQPLSTDGAPAALADALVIGGDPSVLITQ